MQYPHKPSNLTPTVIDHEHTTHISPTTIRTILHPHHSQQPTHYFVPTQLEDTQPHPSYTNTPRTTTSFPRNNHQSHQILPPPITHTTTQQQPLRIPNTCILPHSTTHPTSFVTNTISTNADDGGDLPSNPSIPYTTNTLHTLPHNPTPNVVIPPTLNIQ